MKTKDRHSEVTDAQQRQQLVNCALLVAYIHGLPGGWYGISHGSIDGFPGDYAIIHTEPGDFAFHPMRSFYLTGDEESLDELESIRQAVVVEFGELPAVAKLTEDEKRAAVKSVREAMKEQQPDDAEEWLMDICAESPSYLDYCDWDAVLEAIK